MEVESNGANNDEYIGAKDDCKVARDEQHTSVNPKCSCSQKDRTDTALERPSDLLSSEKDTIRLRIALETISQLEKENEMLESSIRKIQTKTFKRFDSSNWAPDSNEDISRKLDRLESSVRSWAKRHSIPNMRHVQTATPLPPKLLEILKDFAKVEEDLSPLNLPDDKAYVLVEAYVMHQLYCDVFDDPFLWLSDRAGTLIDMSDDAQKTPSSRALRMQSNFESLYEEFRDCKVTLNAYDKINTDYNEAMQERQSPGGCKHCGSSDPQQNRSVLSKTSEE